MTGDWRRPGIHRSVHGAVTRSARNFTSLFVMATLHIHVMRNAPFGITLLRPIRATLKRHMSLVKGHCSKRATGVAAIAAALSGCANSPSIGVLGAYFPDWLFCIVAGVVLTVVIHLVLTRLQADHLMGPSAVVYPTLVAFLSLAVWLVLFQH